VGFDKSDFARQIQERQFGLVPGFFPIVINPANGGPGGAPMTIGESYPININPCDHIWLPTFYDASIGLNPAQDPNDGSNPILFQGPMNNGWNVNVGLPMGMNVFDVFDAANSNGPVQSAVVFALQFNSNNAPWLLWSLSDLLAQDNQPNGNPGGCGCVVGSGDAMRSISGPISSVNFKLLIPAIVAGEISMLGSQIVLMSSLGYRQETHGGKQVNYASSSIGGVNALYPQANGGPSSTFVSGGGYVQTNVNTLEHIELEKRGFGNRGTLQGS